jgi:DNA-binding MarR family transcriptional regulator
VSFNCWAFVPKGQAVDLNRTIDLIASLEASDAKVDERLARADAAVRETIDAVAEILDVDDLDRVIEAMTVVVAGPFGDELVARADGSIERWAEYHRFFLAEARSLGDRGIARLLSSFAGKPRAVLTYLAARRPEEPVQQSDLLHLAGDDPTYLSKVLARLEDADLVMRWRDGKQKLVLATAFGRTQVPAEEPTAEEQAARRYAHVDKLVFGPAQPVVDEHTPVPTKHEGLGRRANQVFGEQPSRALSRERELVGAR